MKPILAPFAILSVAAIVACSPDGPTEPPSPAASMTPADSADAQAEAQEITVSPQSHDGNGTIAIHQGESAVVTVTSASTARCETVGVSGAINISSIFPLGIGGCGGGESDNVGQVETIGPAAADGFLSFFISSSPSSQSLVSGTFPDYTVRMDDGLFDGDFNDVVISVSIQASGPPELNCLPATVPRGDDVTCTISGGTDLQVLGWEFKGKDLKVQSGSTGREWSGPAVEGGEVQAEVEYTDDDGKTVKDKLVAQYAVTARPWPGWQITDVGTPFYVIGPGMRPAPRPNRPIGLFQPVLPDVSTLPLASAGSGPNTGAFYIEPALIVDRALIGIHPGLLPTPPGLMPGDPDYMPWHAWYDDQNGQGGGTCTAADIAVLRQEVERHEGVTMAMNSHFGVANQVFMSEQFQTDFEALFDDSEQDLRDEIRKKLVDTFDKGPYRKAQDNFDKTDTPAIFGGLGCSLDFQPNNP